MADAITIKALQDASLDAKSLEEVVNGNESKQVTTRKGETYPSVKKAIKTMFENGGLPATPFKTKALMTASALVDGKYAMVTDDTTNNGLYVKTAGAWVKSAYDPLKQAKSYTDSEKTSAINIAKTYSDEKLSSVVENKTLSVAAVLVDDDDLVLAEVGTDGKVTANDFLTKSGSLSDSLNKTKGISEVSLDSLAQAFTDEQGTILLGVNTDATLVTPYAPIKGLGIDAIRSQMLPPLELEYAGRYLDKLAAENLEPLNWDVMVAPDSSDGLGINRMASFIDVTDDKYYVVFSQFAGSGTDQTGARLVGRFVDVNFSNKTSVVSETRVIHDSIGSADPAPRHPNLIKVKDGFLLLFNKGYNFNVYKSTDGCKTWSQIFEKIPDEKRTFFLVPDCTTVIPDGFYKGRIVTVGFDNQGKGASHWMLTCLYSDDDGVTWQTGFDVAPSVEFGSFDELNETALTTDTNNDLIMVVRNGEGSATNQTVGKPWFKSTDGGQSIKPHQTITPFTSGSCQNSITQFAPYNHMGVPKIITTSTLPVSVRVGLTLRVSYSNMQTWLGEYAILDGSVTSGYSCVKRVRDSNTLAVVYEYGGYNIKSNIAIRFLNFKEIYNESTI